MSLQLSNVAVTEFDAMVKQTYQGMGKLRPTVTLRTGVVGSTMKFPKIGKGVASLRVPQTDVVPMNVAHSHATATLQDWLASEYTDVFMQAAVNYDEQRELATVIAGGLGRREDQLIIDAMDAVGAASVTQNEGGANTGLNIPKLLAAQKILDDRGVPGSDRFFVMSATGKQQLLTTTEATSSDYNTVKALVTGQIDTFIGFRFIMIETRTEGGLALAANVRTNFAYHKDAVGLAVGIDMRTEVNYVPEKVSHLATGILKAGAVARDTDGIVEVASYEP